MNRDVNLKKDKENANLYLLQAEAAIESGNNEKVVEYLEKAIALTKTNTTKYEFYVTSIEALYLMGEFLFMQGEFQKAKKYLLSAMNSYSLLEEESENDDDYTDIFDECDFLEESIDKSVILISLIERYKEQKNTDLSRIERYREWKKSIEENERDEYDDEYDDDNYD